MEQQNLRERKQHKQENEINEKNSQVKQESKENVDNARNPIVIVIAIISLVFILCYVLPLLRIDLSIRAHYIKLDKMPEWKGNLKENNLLQKAQFFAKGKLRGPETILFVNDTIYTGLANGQLVRVDTNGNVRKVVQIGDGNEADCELPSDEFCRIECGCPLGLRYKSGFIYLADGFHGIHKINPETNEKQILISAKDSRLGGGKTAFDDLDIDDDDNIYFITTTKRRLVDEAFELHLEANPDGRLFRYNQKTNEIKLLLDNMVLPNGLQLTPNKDAIIIAEHCTTRLLKFYIKGEKQGQHEVLAVLPGYPDNIRISERNTLLVPFNLIRSESLLRPSLLDLFGEYPFIRMLIGTFVNLGKVMLKLPYYALIAEYDFNGNLIRSWHDPTGKTIKMISNVAEHNNKFYIGSFTHDFIGVYEY